MDKILIINHGSTFGGSGVACLNIVQSLMNTDHEVVVYCAAGNPAIADALERYDCRVIRAIGSPVSFMHYSGNTRFALSPSFLRNCFKILRDAPKIERVIQQEKPDIVAVNSMTLFWIGPIAKKYGAKTLCFDRETYAHGLMGFRTALIKSFLDRYFDRISFISRFDLDQTKLKRAEGVPLYDAVDIAKFENVDRDQARERLGFDLESKYVLFLGGTSLLKGADVFLKAMDLCGEGIRGVVLNGNQIRDGGGCLSKEQMSVLNLYRKMRHPERILLAPGSDHVEEWYAACDLVVFPSRKAHQAMPIYEAGAAGRPIAVSDFPNTAEFLQNGVNGVSFRPLDAQALAETINTVLDPNNEAVVLDMVGRNRAMAKKDHSIETYGNQIRSFFEI